MKLRITKVIEDWNMHERHKLRRRYAHLKSGDVVLCLNKRRNIARLVDSAGGLHDYYAEKGMRFDLEAVQSMVFSGIRVDLTIGVSERGHARELAIAA